MVRFENQLIWFVSGKKAYFLKALPTPIPFQFIYIHQVVFIVTISVASAMRYGYNLISLMIRSGTLL